jgi:YesN/AraC family two-component response regulator
VVESDRTFTVVGEASDGLTAIQMIADLLPDIVITDINMPGLNGFEIAG